MRKTWSKWWYQDVSSQQPSSERCTAVSATPLLRIIFRLPSSRRFGVYLFFFNYVIVCVCFSKVNSEEGE